MKLASFGLVTLRCVSQSETARSRPRAWNWYRLILRESGNNILRPVLTFPNKFRHFMLHGAMLALRRCVDRFTRATQRRKQKRDHKKKERFPFLVLALMPAYACVVAPVYTLVSCAYAYVCVVRVNQPLLLDKP